MAGPTTRKKGAHCKKKGYKRAHATKSRSRDIDQIQDDLKKEEETGVKMTFELDEDLPGLGQYYCTPCGRHFITANARDVHIASKVHKRRMKDVAQEQYTQKEAERAAGKSIETYTPAHPTAASS
ncbi:hypothetical protein H310_02743 [Aphanomyces invadans]|uniref:C2H2-type domain-containing protein n=1 Tax=Aphanomyces invadans TaxID=157072 RepID=A0A024UJ99_9STRA|nr:hypothetical protein H310_02743 [Aphanomyces invadans]ETW06511.1 hypothetical protein H310_02743 [Aphanomyces invadans]RHY30110.1 hypothetical protein DYB32_004599 [Aphanomyces invadans]|eukprot:XP_008864586.1 hypothetical protein H310_02743 [Aphanomyces invadans]